VRRKLNIISNLNLKKLGIGRCMDTKVRLFEIKEKVIPGLKKLNFGGFKKNTFEDFENSNA
jgi:hypothetical protein